MKTIDRIGAVVQFAMIVIICGCATTQQTSQVGYSTSQEPDTQLEIAFKEKDYATGREMWLTSEMTVRSVSGPSASAASVLPCSFDLRVTQDNRSVASPTVVASDPSMVTASIGFGGIVSLTVTKEGTSTVTITSGSRSQTLSVWTVAKEGMFQCGVALADR
jgi:hypothetical protein